MLAPDRKPWSQAQASAVAGAVALGVLSLGFILWGVGDLDKDGTNNMAELQSGSNPFSSPRSHEAAGQEETLACQLGLEECEKPAEPQQAPAPTQERAVWATSGFAFISMVVAAYGAVMMRRFLLR